MDAGFAAGHLPQRARRRGVPQRGDPLPDRDYRWTGNRVAGRLGLFRALFTRRQIACLQPSSVDLVAQALSRELCRRSVGREPGEQDVYAAPFRPALQPVLADVGRRRCDLFRGGSAAERGERQTGGPGSAAERQQHLQDPGAGRRPAGAGHEARRRKSVLAVNVERRQSHRL